MGEFDLIARFFKRPAQRQPLGVGDLKFRKSLSTVLMKNCAVAECGALVRAMAKV